MRFLVLNPNTSQDVSEKLRVALCAALRPGESLHVETAADGVPYIGDRVTMAIGAASARASLRRALRHDSRGYDAVVLGCFADLETERLGEVAQRPVVNLLDASLLMADRAGSRWSIVTAGAVWQDLLPGMCAASGARQSLRGWLASVRTYDAAEPALAARRDAQHQEVGRLAGLCAQHDGADVVIVGGAGLAGLAGASPPAHAGVVVLDSALAGLCVARELALAARPAMDPRESQ
jgi:allantoin racemase